MDHAIYPYRARPLTAAQAGEPSRLQAFALIILEHWEADPPADARRDGRFVGEYGSFDPDFRSWTQREYGLRIGIFRVLDALAEAGIRPAVAISARLLERDFDWIERLSGLGVEWIAHGIAANQMMDASMSAEAQRSHIETSKSALEQRIGQVPAGWLSQDWGTSPDTFEWLAQAGFRYTLDWCNDDAPFALSTSSPLFALPLSAEWDDVQCQWLRNLDPQAHAQLTESAFRRLQSECQRGHGPAVFGLPIHPWVTGMSSRIGAFRSLLSRLTEVSEVDWRLPGEIVQQMVPAITGPVKRAQETASTVMKPDSSGLRRSVGGMSDAGNPAAPIAAQGKPAPQTGSGHSPASIAMAERIAFSAMPDRAALKWPNGARIAIWVAPNVEHYEYRPAFVRVRDPWPRVPHPDILGYGLRDYGNRVGFWRLMEVFDRLSVRCTVSLSMAVLDMYPAIAEAMLERRWEFMSHGLYNTRYHWNLSEDEERAEIEAAQQIHRRHTGRGLPGWFSPAASNTRLTPDLVAEAGIGYLCDLYHDDQPTPVRVRQGGLISLPYSMEINDSICWRRGMEAEAFAQKMIDEFDTLYAEGGRVMNIAVHPFITGQPHRIDAFERALEHILTKPGVWCATGEEIVQAYRAQNGVPPIETGSGAPIS